MKRTIKVIIPAYNEADSIAHVINDIPPIVDEVIVVNNNSTDDTVARAQAAGATVLTENRKGYGYACLKGMDHIAQQTPPDVVVFLDGDYSDYPEELTKIVAPIEERDVDFVVGARDKKLREKGSMTLPQIFGNWLATSLIKLFYGVKYTDLGPFRAIRYDSLMTIAMKDRTYGWTVEMQLKAAKLNLRTVDIPVNYRQRIGVSKVSGTLKGTIGAGYKIILTIFKYL